MTKIGGTGRGWIVYIYIQEILELIENNMIWPPYHFSSPSLSSNDFCLFTQRISLQFERNGTSHGTDHVKPPLGKLINK